MCSALLFSSCRPLTSSSSGRRCKPTGSRRMRSPTSISSSRARAGLLIPSLSVSPWSSSPPSLGSYLCV
eukprot:98561-Hanusia_phi.AAC.2